MADIQTDANIKLSSETFDLLIHNGAIVGLRRVLDSFDTEYILPGKRLGDLIVKYRKGTDDWIRVDTADLANEGKIAIVDSRDGMQYGADYDSSDVVLKSVFNIKQDTIDWQISITNQLDIPVEIGDLAIPLDMNTRFEWNKPATESVFKHSFISGHCSYMFWMRPNSVGPYLTMTPGSGTKLEFYDSFRSDTAEGSFKAYIHSAAEGEIAREKGCNWRQPNTSAVLGPKGSDTDSLVYSFKFQWADDYDRVRDIIVEEGLIDIQVVPGMVVPTDLFAKFSMRTDQPIKSIEPEFPEKTRIDYIGQTGGSIHLYQVKFDRLGENYLKISFGEDKEMILEFFATEPVETLINKRGAFIANHSICDESKWYNGLLAEWNMETQTLLSPDNYDRIKGWRIYEVTCDDPGLSKPSFLASKNAECPEQAEVDALDYYIEHFVWGGLQMTTDEEYPYAIYGIPDWKALRDSADPGPKGRSHIWRIYDYPHIALTYFGMYLVARRYQHINTKLDKLEYLKRAYGTAVAMFTIPWETGEWTAYQTGLYNELIYPEIIAALEEEGLTDSAFRLRKHWEKKVCYFVNDNPSMFGSEYPFDSTGFESTHAFAKWAMENAVDIEAVERNEKRTIIRENADKFMQMQTDCNIFCRGWLEPAYFWYGSDYRGGGNTAYTLSYMAQMGGWSLLDYALYYAEDPYPYLRLGYASFLSSWALMNTGTPESNYGYWYPGVENDGGAGGGFEPAPYGFTWLEQPHSRGSWYYSCEIDLGFSGGLRCARTIIADDPIFGLFCYGGDYVEEKGMLSVWPKDGLRKRFHAIVPGKKAHLALDTDKFSSIEPIKLNRDLSTIEFSVESYATKDHSTKLSISGLPEGRYSLKSGDSLITDFDSASGNEVRIEIPVSGSRVACCIYKS